MHWLCLAEEDNQALKFSETLTTPAFPGSLAPRLFTDPGSAELMSRLAERVGFEPTQTPIENSKLLKCLRLAVPWDPLASPHLAVDLAVALTQRGCAVRA